MVMMVLPGFVTTVATHTVVAIVLLCQPGWEIAVIHHLRLGNEDRWLMHHHRSGLRNNHRRLVHDHGHRHSQTNRHMDAPGLCRQRQQEP